MYEDRVFVAVPNKILVICTDMLKGQQRLTVTFEVTLKEDFEEYYHGMQKSPPINEARRIRRTLTLDWLKRRRCRRICDVGCGNGYDAHYFHRMGFEVYGCDISEKAISLAKKMHPGPTYYICDIENEALPVEYIDAIYSFDVIEHIPDYSKYLENCSFALERGGLLIIATTNVLAPRNRLRILLGRDTWFRKKLDVHFFSPDYLQTVIKDEGFEVLRMYGSGRLSWMGIDFSGYICVVAEKDST